MGPVITNAECLSFKSLLLSIRHLGGVSRIGTVIAPIRAVISIGVAPYTFYVI